MRLGVTLRVSPFLTRCGLVVLLRAVRWFAPYPEPRPDHARGALARSLQPAEVDRLHRGVAHSEVGLWHLPRASDFSSDKTLNKTMALLAEMDALGILDELHTQITVARRSRMEGDGRPRMPGRPIVLYLAYVDSRRTSVQFFHAQMTNELLTLASYGDREPVLSEVEDRFAEIEEDWNVLRAVRLALARGAAQAEPRLLQTGWGDGTATLSRIRLRHACEGPCNSRAKTIGSSAPAAIDAARWNEVSRADYGTEHFAPASGRTRLDHAQFVSNGHGEPKMSAVFRSKKGCMYVARDPEVGFRSFENDARWVGFMEVAIGLNYVDEQLDAEYVPADVNETDALPGLFNALGASLFPQVISLDRAYYTRPVFQFLTRRGVAPVVVPERRFPGKTEHGMWRSERFDEDGVVRCKGCGGPTNQAVAGGGLHQVHNEPRVRGRCLLPYDDHCDGWSTLACSTEWLKVTALNATHPLYHAVAARHSHPEALNERSRRRHQTGAKEVSMRLQRRGLAAQRLRKQASLLLTWTRLCLRNGWLAPAKAEIVINDATPVLLSGTYTRAGRMITPGIGADSLMDTRAERAASGADRPYGTAQAAMLARLRGGGGEA